MLLPLPLLISYFSSPRVEVTRAVLNQGKRFVAVMALDTGVKCDGLSPALRSAEI